MNGQTNAAVIELSLANGVPLFAGFNPGLLNRVLLNESIKLALIAPAAVEVVKVNSTRVDITDNGIPPVRKPHGPAGLGCAEQLRFRENGPREFKAFAGIDGELFRSD